MSGTVWLASYPKSGNTWLRVFLANLLHPERRPLDINALPVGTPIAAHRQPFDRILRVPSAFLTLDEAARLRPEVDRLLSAPRNAPPLMRKVHDAYTWLPDGRPLLGRAPGVRAIYVLRDPWDVAVSTAHHFGISLDEAVSQLDASGRTLASRAHVLTPQLGQRLLSWHGHALSWLHAPMPLHLLRYETMWREPLACFRGAARFLGLEHDDAAIGSALEASRLEHLQRQERDRPFRETPAQVERFFRRGRVGEGRARLTSEQLARLDDMKRQVERAIALRGLDA